MNQLVKRIQAGLKESPPILYLGSTVPRPAGLQGNGVAEQDYRCLVRLLERGCFAAVALGRPLQSLPEVLLPRLGGWSRVEAPEQSPDWRGLAVSILHKLVLEKLVPTKLGGTPTCQYVHLLKEVTDATAAKQCQVAALVPPCGMEHVEAIAGNREKMPPKSTYFFPKLLTGMVFNSLKKD